MENNSKKTIVIATANPHKLEEISEINTFENISFSLVEGEFNPEETGATFKENAFIKAKSAAEMMKKCSLADDSGLCVDALDGAPGLYSSRYAFSQTDKINKLIENLKSVAPEKRTAHFICSMVLVDENGNILHSTEGKVDGLIIDTPIGEKGFGYDPIFFVPEFKTTMAQMDSKTKNSISHRARALKPMLEWIEHNL